MLHPDEILGFAQREGEVTALNIFIGVSTNENTGRESEVPTEPFMVRLSSGFALPNPEF